MPREFKHLPRPIVVKTKIGSVYLTFITATQARLSTNDGQPHLVANVNGIGCNVSLSLVLAEDGRWKTEAEATGKNNHERFYPLYMSRDDHSGREVSLAAKEKAIAVLAEYLNEWVEKNADEAKELRTVAELVQVNNDIFRVDEKIDELQTKLGELQRQRMVLTEREDSIQNDEFLPESFKKEPEFVG